MTGNTHNRNVRFYEEKEDERHLAISDDPYLETRGKEDAFADRIVEKRDVQVLSSGE